MCESSSVSPSVSPSRSFDRRLLYRDVVFVRMLLMKDDIVSRGGVARAAVAFKRFRAPLCTGSVARSVRTWLRARRRWVAPGQFPIDSALDLPKRAIATTSRFHTHLAANDNNPISKLHLRKSPTFGSAGNYTYIRR